MAQFFAAINNGGTLLFWTATLHGQSEPRGPRSTTQVRTGRRQERHRDATPVPSTKPSDAVRRLEQDPVAPALRIAARYLGFVRQVSRDGQPRAVSVVVERLAMMTAQERVPAIQRALLSYLVEAQAAIGNFAAAVRTVNQWTEGLGQGRSLTVIASEQARQGDPKGALALAARVPRESWTTGDLMVFARALDAG